MVPNRSVSKIAIWAIQHFCYFSSYSIDVITWHPPTQTKLFDFPFQRSDAKNALIISLKKQAYFSVCKSIEKVFRIKFSTLSSSSAIFITLSPSLCEVVKFDCKKEKVIARKKVLS